MSDRAETQRLIETASRELIPALTERLQRHGLGEIVVRHGALRVRVAGVPTGETTAPDVAGPDRASERHVQRGVRPHGDGTRRDGVQGEAQTETHRQPVPSPAVGFFVYADGLGTGVELQKGDGVGWIEVLGVRHDVRAPRSGTVRGLLAENGEAVEYGQALVELEVTRR